MISFLILFGREDPQRDFGQQKNSHPDDVHHGVLASAKPLYTLSKVAPQMVGHRFQKLPASS